MKQKYFLRTVLLCLISAAVLSCGNNENANHKKENTKMKKRIINPWTWQDKYGFVQANEVTGAKRMLFCAGQISVDDNGNILYPGDMAKQINQIFDNLETILEQSNFKLSDVVRFTYFTTDIEAFKNTAGHVLSERFEEGECKPASSLIGVAALSWPECVVEIEATVMN